MPYNSIVRQNQKAVEDRTFCLDYLGNHCKQCDSQKNLEFDHIDPATKSWEITTRLGRASRQTLALELIKCQLLCESCHAEKTRKEQSVERGWRHGTWYSWMKKKCNCGVCQATKQEFHSTRNAKRRILDTGRGKYQRRRVQGILLSGAHGNSGYRIGCRCNICKEGHRLVARKKDQRE